MKILYIIIILFCFNFAVSAGESEKGFERGKPVTEENGAYFQGDARVSGEDIEKSLLSIADLNPVMNEVVDSRNKAITLTVAAGASAVLGTVCFLFLPRNPVGPDNVGDFIGGILTGSALCGLALISGIAAVSYTFQTGDNFKKAIDAYNKNLQNEGLEPGTMLLKIGPMISLNMEF